MPDSDHKDAKNPIVQLANYQIVTQAVSPIRAEMTVQRFPPAAWGRRHARFEEVDNAADMDVSSFRNCFLAAVE